MDTVSFLTALAVIGKVSGQSPGSITVVKNVQSNTVNDWLIVAGTFFGLLLLLILLLSELLRCCRLDCRRRKMKQNIQKPFVSIDGMAGTPGSFPVDDSREFNVVNVDQIASGNDRALKKALTLSRVTAAREEEERQIRIAMERSLLDSKDSQYISRDTSFDHASAPPEYIISAQPPNSIYPNYNNVRPSSSASYQQPYHSRSNSNPAPSSVNYPATAFRPYTTSQHSRTSSVSSTYGYKASAPNPPTKH